MLALLILAMGCSPGVPTGSPPTESALSTSSRAPYRVLLTRGLRGCYVYFQDQQTQDFVLSRLDRPRSTLARSAEPIS
jgi:hypothetical protein